MSKTQHLLVPVLPHPECFVEPYKIAEKYIKELPFTILFLICANCSLSVNKNHFLCITRGTILIVPWGRVSSNFLLNKSGNTQSMGLWDTGQRIDKLSIFLACV